MKFFSTNFTSPLVAALKSSAYKPKEVAVSSLPQLEPATLIQVKRIRAIKYAKKYYNFEGPLMAAFHASRKRPLTEKECDLAIEAAKRLENV